MGFENRLDREKEQARPEDFPPWQQMVAFCAERPHCLSADELDFIDNLSDWPGELSLKQFKWLTGIFKRIRGPMTDPLSLQIMRALKGED